MALLLSNFQLMAQRHEFGLGLGATNYVGDLVPVYQLENHRPAAELFYRYNLSQPVNLRLNALGGKLTGSDQTAYDAFAEQRRREFDTFVVEVAALFEYNFLDYRRVKSKKKPKNSEQRFSPYFFAGFGMLWRGSDHNDPEIPDYSKYQPVVPFGLGMKYRLNPYWTLGAEWGARKTFFDYLDNVGDMQPREDGSLPKTYQYGNINQKDWYFFTGITLSYTLWTIPCPFDYVGAGYKE